MITDRAKILRRVRALRARANHSSTPVPEASAAQAKADELEATHALVE